MLKICFLSQNSTSSSQFCNISLMRHFFLLFFFFRERQFIQTSIRYFRYHQFMCMFYRETFPILYAIKSSRRFLSRNEATETRRNVRMAIGQKLCIPSVRSQTAIYNYSLRPRDRGSFFRRESVGLAAETRHRPPPLLEIHRGWRVAFTLHGSIEKGGRTDRGRTIIYELLAGSKFVWMPPGYPERRFFSAHQELGLAEKQEVVKEPRLSPFACSVYICTSTLLHPCPTRCSFVYCRR